MFPFVLVLSHLLCRHLHLELPLVWVWWWNVILSCLSSLQNPSLVCPLIPHASFCLLYLQPSDSLEASVVEVVEQLVRPLRPHLHLFDVHRHRNKSHPPRRHHRFCLIFEPGRYRHHYRRLRKSRPVLSSYLRPWEAEQGWLQRGQASFEVAVLVAQETLVAAEEQESHRP